MKKLDKQKKQLIILSVLLLIIGIANYFNYYSPPKSLQDILSFSKLDEQEQKDLVDEARSHEIFDPRGTQKKVVEAKKAEVSVMSKADDNYLNYAIDSSGKLVRWNKNRIIVFVGPTEYRYTIYQALGHYNSVFEGYFRFFITRDIQRADITVDVVDSFDSNENRDSLYMAGITNNTISGNSNSISKSRIQLLKYKPNSKKQVTKKEMYPVVLHELGHALGIADHSPNNSDLMFASASNSTDFSKRDVNTLKLMYSDNEKVISDITKDFKSERLTEAKKYTKMSPNKALAWVNLAKVYFDQGKKEESIEAYKKAISLEPRNPLVYQSLAECYYLSEKYDNAIYYYMIASNLSKTNEDRISQETMIGMCHAKKNDYPKAYEYFEKVFRFDSTILSSLKNYLVSCIELDKKLEARSAIEDYFKATRQSASSDEFINDAMKWAGMK